MTTTKTRETQIGWLNFRHLKVGLSSKGKASSSIFSRPGPKLSSPEGQCNPNPCLNNGECEPKGRGKFKCDCPRPFRGRKCEKGLHENPYEQIITVEHFIYLFCMISVCSMCLLKSSQDGKFAGRVCADEVNVCWRRLPRTSRANASCHSNHQTAEHVSKLISVFPIREIHGLCLFFYLAWIYCRISAACQMINALSLRKRSA